MSLAPYLPLTPWLRQTYPREKFKFQPRAFNGQIRGKNVRFLGLFARERKHRGKPGHWFLLTDKQRRPILVKIH